MASRYQSEGNVQAMPSKLVYVDLKTTGFKKDAQACQIGSCCEDEEFTCYTCPTIEFELQATYKTYFYSNEGVLYQEGRILETLPMSEAWERFLRFLEEKCGGNVTLVMHRDAYHLPIIKRHLKELGLLEKFSVICKGVIDTLQLFRKEYPQIKEEGRGYELDELLSIIGLEETKPSELDALVAAKNLKELVDHEISQGNIDSYVLNNYFKSLTYIQEAENAKEDAKILKTEMPSLSKETAEKLVGAGISYYLLLSTYNEAGESGIRSLLSEEVNGQVRVTKSSMVIRKNIYDLQNRIKTEVSSPLEEQ
ncbi:uncharacterized protein [Anabrus simplex]|uniref:uncharacterized protein n=1 Tax=Anabrus simplex TaxID=316456 RepID=UPI0035A38958